MVRNPGLEPGRPKSLVSETSVSTKFHQSRKLLKLKLLNYGGMVRTRTSPALPEQIYSLLAQSDELYHPENEKQKSARSPEAADAGNCMAEGEGIEPLTGQG